MHGRIVLVLVSLFLPGQLLAGGDGGGHSPLVTTIGLVIVTAAALTILFHKIKLPALIAYILSGLLISSFAGSSLADTLPLINQVAGIGLIFLLFIVGMEMDPTVVKLLGPRTTIAIFLQAPASMAVAVGLQWLVAQSGLSIPGLSNSPSAWLYYAVACSLGSTAVVIKLLGDKFDLGSQAGKITVVALIMADVWAIASLSYVKSQSADTEPGQILMMVFGGIALALVIIVSARLFLARIMEQMSRSPELMLLMALGWCFLCAESFGSIGLSAEIGALIAGLTVGRLPHHTEILSKVVSLKEFFMALFFVGLGVSLPPPSLEILPPMLVLAATVVVVRLVSFSPMLLAAGQAPIVSFAAAINIGQMSVFGMLLLPVGMTNGVIAANDVIILTYAMLASFIISSFSITNNYRLSLKLARALGLNIGSKDSAIQGHHVGEHGNKEIIMLGFFVNGPAIARYLEKHYPEYLEKMLIIDFNISKERQMQFPKTSFAYGDFSNTGTLRHYGIDQAKVIISTINNAFLHNISNQDLLHQIHMLNPNARIITTCLSEEDGARQMQAGAFRSISTPIEAAPAYTQAILDAIQSIEQDEKEIADEQVAREKEVVAEA